MADLLDNFLFEVDKFFGNLFLKKGLTAADGVHSLGVLLVESLLVCDEARDSGEVVFEFVFEEVEGDEIFLEEGVACLLHNNTTPIKCYMCYGVLCMVCYV